MCMRTADFEVTSRVSSSSASKAREAGPVSHHLSIGTSIDRDWKRGHVHAN